MLLREVISGIGLGLDYVHPHRLSAQTLAWNLVAETVFSQSPPKTLHLSDTVAV